MFADYHVHSEFSDDSAYPLEEVVKDAIRLKLDEICITDHVDYGVKQDWDCGRTIEYRGSAPLANVDYPRYMARIDELKKQYGEQITIKTGMEFGVQIHTIPQFESLYSRYPFDFILLSIHQVEDQEFWTQDFQQGRTQQEYNERYYEEMLQVVRQYKHYSVLAHLDLITRYDQAGVYPFVKVRDRIAEILQQVIRDGKGIEVNTSCHRYGLKDLTPSREILGLYRELGGTIITLGSDAHKAEHLAAYMKETREELRKMGFSSLCTFQNMEPVFHSL